MRFLFNFAMKHVVVEAVDRTELIQMIGRKRLDDGGQVNVYVANVDEDTVDYRLSQVHEWLGRPESYSEMNWLIRSLYSTDKKALLNFLMEHAEEPVPASEWPDVLQTLRELVIKVVKKQHDDTRQLGWKALNDRLKEAEMPYEIVPGKNESYMIVHEE